MENNKKVMIIYNDKEKKDRDFYEKFIEALKSEKKVFKIDNAVVEGDISIFEVYTQIKNDIELNKLITVKEFTGESMVNVRKCVYINIPVSIIAQKVEFKGALFFYGGSEGIIFKHNNEDVFISLIFKKEVKFYISTFEKEAYFRGIIFDEYIEFTHFTFKKELSFENSVIKNCQFFHATFKKEAYFSKTIFNDSTIFIDATFEGKAEFNHAEFKGKAEFNYAKFEKNVDFSKVIFNKTKFSESTFKSRADFDDIIFNLLSFVKCRFRDTTSFKKDVLNNEKIKRLKNRLENDEIMTIYEYENLAIFNFVVFDENTTIDNFPLSKTSFLRTDVRKIMLMEYIEKDEGIIEKEGILSYNLLINKNKYEGHNDNKNTYNEAYDILKPNLKNKSVLAEYRNLRLSVEDNITYEEASNLYKLEMELRKKHSDNKFEKVAIWVYGKISNYGESVGKSVLCIFCGLIIFTILASILRYIVEWDIFKIIEFWGVSLFEVIRIALQMGTEDKSLWLLEPLIRITSLILLGNLYIAIRRRLSRK